MLKIILLILFTYVVYRFLLKYIMQKMLSLYLNKEKKRFYRDNPHIDMPKSENENSFDFGYRRKKSLTRIKRYLLFTR